MTFDRLPDDQSYRTHEVEVLRPMVHQLQKELAEVEAQLQKELAAVKRERAKLRKQVERLAQENRDLMAGLVQKTEGKPA